WCGGQKPYPLRGALAELLGLAREKVRVVWMPGPGSYGMNDADDCAADAAVIAQAVGRPVRVQYMRAEGTGWDPNGPPIAFRRRGRARRRRGSRGLPPAPPGGRARDRRGEGGGGEGGLGGSLRAESEGGRALRDRAWIRVCTAQPVDRRDRRRGRGRARDRPL